VSLGISRRSSAVDIAGCLAVAFCSPTVLKKQLFMSRLSTDLQRPTVHCSDRLLRVLMGVS
jgi:hypothetical protein